MGLYLNPPEHAVVLCVDEKSQVQALDQHPTDSAAATGVALNNEPYDYERHGTTACFSKSTFEINLNQIKIHYTNKQNTHNITTTKIKSLFAALDLATGKVIGKCRRRHRHQEFLQFMEYVDSGLPPEAGEIHLVLDNYGTHKTPQVVRWFARHPRYHLHFTPTSGSWVNQVERWFAEITNKRIRRGSFDSVRSLEKAIEEYLAV